MQKRDIDWSLAASQLLRAIRGKRSQKALSMRLGYSGRPVADWEGGRRFPTAAVTLKVARAAHLDVDAAFERFHPPSASALGQGDDEGVARWLTELRSAIPINELAKRSGHPRFSVSRWLRGDSRPRLPQFLSLVQAITGRASDLIAELVDISLVDAVKQDHEQRASARRVAFEEPWSAAILRLIETAAYQSLAAHRSGWLSEVLQIDLNEEDRCLDRLVKAGMVDVNAKTGKLTCSATTVDTHASTEDMNRLKAHWAEVARDRCQAPHPGDLFAFNVVSVSREDHAHIEQLLRATYREIRSVVAASTPIETAALVQLQLTTWGEAPKT